MTHQQENITLTVVDDHQLFRKGLINLIEQVDSRFKVIAECSNGKELMDQLAGGTVPEIVVMDVNMPIMDGFKTTEAIKEHHPDVAVLALTMLNDENTLIRLLRAGVNGFLNKDIEPDELQKAIAEIHSKGDYYTEYVAGKLVSILRQPKATSRSISELNEQELRFIRLCCSELTYQAIADEMCLSVKTIDGYRSKIFEKLDVKSRVGMVIFAIKNNLVSIDQLD